MLKVEIQNINLIQKKMRVVTTPYYFAIANKEIPEHHTRRVVGYNSAVGTTLEDIYETSVGSINLPTTAVAMEVVSSSANDASGNTGIRVVEIHGLNINFDEISETLTMNGVTPVACTNLYRRINNFHGMDVGSNGVAVGTILLRGAGAGVTYSQITAGGNMALQCIFTIPNNYRGFVIGWSAGATTKDTKILLRAKRDWDLGILTNLFLFQDVIVHSGGHTYKPLDIPLSLPPKCDIKVSAAALVAGAQVSASIELFYEKILTNTD
jgi:hypothetical protein